MALRRVINSGKTMALMAGFSAVSSTRILRRIEPLHFVIHHRRRLQLKIPRALRSPRNWSKAEFERRTVPVGAA